MKIARDRGYFTIKTLAYNLALEMDASASSIEHLIRSGKLRWEHILFFGDFFEMTPKEFCDTFLHGYFQENAQGHYVAKFQNAKMLLDRKRNVQSRSEVFGDLTEFDELEEIIIK